MQNVLKNLGAGLLRIGGNSQDKTFWSPGARDTRSDGGTVLVGSDFDRLFAMSASTGWKVILGLNLGAALPDTFAAEAAFASSRSAGYLKAVEIGNEPDLFAKNGLRPTTYTYTQYANDLALFLAAMTRRAPGIPVVAPATAFDTAWLRQTVAANPSRFTFATTHRYPTGNDSTIAATSIRYASIPNLLSDSLRRANLAYLTGAAAGPKAYFVNTRLAETNSAYNGGKPGVSDVFASALWAIDHAYTAAEAGMTGVNFHGAIGGGTYSAFTIGTDGTVTARPLYYGLLAFQDAAQGQVLLPKTNYNAAWNLSVHASFTASDGTVRIVLVNKDTATLAVKLIVPAATVVTARRLAAGTLSSPLSATTGISYGGGTLTTAGTFAPTTSESFSPTLNTVVITVPFASAAVVTAKR
jgi:hypothetical protein